MHFEITLLGLMANNPAFGSYFIDNMQNLFTYTNLHNQLFFCQHTSLAVCASVCPLAIMI